MPLETEDYVLSLTGQPVEHFIERSNESKDRPLHAKLSFDEACRRLPVIAAATVPMSSLPRFPWVIQVAGSFQRSVGLTPDGVGTRSLLQRLDEGG